MFGNDCCRLVVVCFDRRHFRLGLFGFVEQIELVGRSSLGARGEALVLGQSKFFFQCGDLVIFGDNQRFQFVDVSGRCSTAFAMRKS
jgi:hypothetical protein